MSTTKINWFGYRRGRLNVVQGTVLRLALLACAAGMVLPLAWMTSTALKDERAFQNDPLGWVPKVPPYIVAGSLAIDHVYAVTEDFEDVPLEDFESAALGPAVSPEAARAGRFGLRLGYDFRAAGTRARASVPLEPKGPTRDCVTLVGFWLKGDGSGHNLSVRIAGRGVQYVSAESLPITFRGWKEVVCFLRPERFEPLGKAIIQMRGEQPEGGLVAGEALKSLELTLEPTTRARQVWMCLTDSFRRAWSSMPFGRFYLNSLFVAIAVTIGQTLTSSLAAYAFARLEFPGRDRIFLTYLATMMIPGAVLIVPTFLLMRWLDWFDSYWALIAPAMFSAYGTFMLRQFFLTLPRDLEDAARIDGCGKLRVWLHVILPLSKPALATLATFTFLGTWESFQWPLFATKSMDMRVLQVGLSAFQDKFGVQYNLMMAAALIVMVPTLIVFVFNQRFFTRGIVLSGMKE
jgi:multiple sugar transport system permease protein